MTSLRRFWSSIIVQVTTLTVTTFVFLFISFVVLTQTLFTSTIFSAALKDNSDSIAELVWLVENSPEELYPFVLSSYRSGSRLAAIGDNFHDGLQKRPEMRRQLENSDSDVADRLNNRTIRFQQLRFSNLRKRTMDVANSPLRAPSALQVSIELENQRVLHIWMAPSVTLASRPVPLLFVTLGVTGIALALGFALASIILRPLKRLERAADRVDLIETGNPLREEGPLEVRRLSATLNRMRMRLACLIGEREQIIAAIAHDIRTGLHRIRLRMDGQAEVSPSEIESDISQMEKLISDMLAYARAESPSGPRELINLNDFMNSVATGAPFPVSISDRSSGFQIAGDPIALRRMFENLLENARRYGRGEISIQLAQSEEGLQVAVNDNGPGLPPDQLEAVFEPFKRGEQSRNRETGGAGLGLGISRAIARAHGATLSLENRLSGGLSAIVVFPEALRT